MQQPRRRKAPARQRKRDKYWKRTIQRSRPWRSQRSEHLEINQNHVRSASHQLSMPGYAEDAPNDAVDTRKSQILAHFQRSEPVRTEISVPVPEDWRDWAPSARLKAGTGPGLGTECPAKGRDWGLSPCGRFETSAPSPALCEAWVASTMNHPHPPRVATHARSTQAETDIACAAAPSW